MAFQELVKANLNKVDMDKMSEIKFLNVDMNKQSLALT